MTSPSTRHRQTTTYNQPPSKSAWCAFGRLLACQVVVVGCFATDQHVFANLPSCRLNIARCNSLVPLLARLGLESALGKLGVSDLVPPCLGLESVHFSTHISK